MSDIKICPDLAHLAAGGGDPLEIVKKYYDRISFVHLKDLDENGFAPLGTGHVDVEGSAVPEGKGICRRLSGGG